jgi:hypothetical protein
VPRAKKPKVKIKRKKRRLVGRIAFTLHQRHVDGRCVIARRGQRERAANACDLRQDHEVKLIEARRNTLRALAYAPKAEGNQDGDGGTETENG